MGKSEVRAELIRFCDSIRNYEHESGHSIYNDERESSEFVDIYLGSQSPTEPELDTLQEGNWFQGTEEEYRMVFEIENNYENLDTLYRWIWNAYKAQYLCFDGIGINWTYSKKTQLTPEEFLRRAENTFKTK